MSRIRARLTYANVVATVALFLALAGGTTAIALSGSNTVASDDIIKGQVKSSDIGGSQVANGDLAKDSVSGGKVKPETLFGADIGTDAIGASEVAPGAVGGVEVFDTSLTGADLADGSVASADLAAVPAARVGISNPFAANDNQLESVQFETDTASGTYDPFNMWTSANADDVVVPLDGMYVATGRVRWNNDSPTTDPGWRLIQISAPNQNHREVIAANTHGTETMGHIATVILNLEAGEDVSLNAGQSSATPADINVVEAWLAVSWIGPSPGPVN